MSLAATPFGLRPAFHPSGLDRAKAYTVANQYATNIFKGDPVALNSSGVLVLGTVGSDILGVFAGCEYTDAATGKRVVSPFWPASTNTVQNDPSRPLVCWVWDDPAIIYEAQTDGTSVFAQAWIGGQMNMATYVAGSTSTGQSAVTLTSSTYSVSAQKQFRILDVGRQLDNSPYDTTQNTYMILQVQIAQHQFVANKVAV